MTLNKILNYIIAAVWLVNGLFCKVLNEVPRHQEIVARILGSDHAAIFTEGIGVAEIVMAVWIVSGYWSRLNAIMQILVIGTMNILEFFLVPDLLLWGRFNLLFAVMFISVIAYNEYYLKSKPVQPV
ncbi:hypothetical protein A4H97_21675 [Niastella yeongjuensis]|uniref:DoxX family protein n=1 Tax=Niastella yeongjuensis TaxID=354355 RepID=A0A1V9F8I9_9BACT|nr:DoxX-like family protein [Niastella yeongjuensis]OQP54582.1 hypothetical protein A4H97_21675 [Niastella yeongjuensis]SEN99624.1 DoxX-like family protein [Niastella yeongjuensis]